MANPDGNHFMERMKAKGKNGHGLRSEKRVVQSIAGARGMPGSGAMRGAKSDAVVERPRMDFRLECKATDKQTMTIELAWLVKVYTEALETGKMPALSVSFVSPDGKARPLGDWVMIPKAAYEELTE